MSRFLKVMIVLLAIAAMVAPAMAEDRLTLSGQMRVRGWSKDFDAKGYGTNTYGDQRLRLGGKLSVAEGVSITIRTDITESTWGGGNAFGSGRIDTQQWDRAHIDLTMGQSHVRAGQQYVQYGNIEGGVINMQSNGLRYDYNGDISFSTFLLLTDNNNGHNTDKTDSNLTNFGNNQDAFLAGANLGHKGDNYTSNLYVGAEKNARPFVEKYKDADGTEHKIAEGTAQNDQGGTVYVIGVDTTYTMDAFTIKGEFDYFTGEASQDVDAVGTQFFLDVAMAASEQFTIGGQFYYADGTKKDDEKQYTYLGQGDFDGWDPLFDVGTSLSNEQINVNRPFDLATAVVKTLIPDFDEGDAMGSLNTGVIGARLYTSYKASDAVTLGASVAYMEPEEDANVKDFDSATFFGLGATYALMANTSLQAQVNYIDADIKHSEVDSALMGGVGLFVNF